MYFVCSLFVGIIVDVLEDFMNVIISDQDFPALTTRKLEVGHGVAAGWTNKEIAVELGISRHTVRIHLKDLYKIYNVDSRAELVNCFGSTGVEILRKSSRPKPFSFREKQVFELIAMGCSTKEIRLQLGIARKTVNSHRQSIVKKVRHHM